MASKRLAQLRFFLIILEFAFVAIMSVVSGTVQSSDRRPSSDHDDARRSVLRVDKHDDEMLHGTSGVHVPTYMIELYESVQQTSKSNFDLPPDVSDTVRCYVNVNGGFDADRTTTTSKRELETRIHTLSFNVPSTMASSEVLQQAELRLYALVSRDRRNFAGIDRRVSVFLVDSADGDLVLLDTRHLYEMSNAWETFDVTAAVAKWTTSGRHQQRQEQRLEVHIENAYVTVGGSGQMDVDVSPFVETEPLLLVYSNNRKPEEDERRHKRSVRNEVVDYEEETTNVIAEDAIKTPSVPNKSRRRKHRNPCRRKQLFVNFTEINYDTWIIAPRGYEAYECSGKCYFPLSDHLTPTEHAVVQTLVHTLTPRKAARACCVPTKLDSISILYVDKDGVVTYKYRHEDMVVIECGCR